MIQGAIFDADGTLLDSMEMWSTIGEKYLRSIGYEPREDFNRVIKEMDLYCAARYCRAEYGVSLSVDAIVDGVIAMTERYYREEAPLKTGVADFLRFLQDKGVAMCIATATKRSLLESALERCGIRRYFSEIFTCSSVGHGKDEPVIYREALKHLGTTRMDTVIFEDAFHAVQTAKRDGFTVAAVYDNQESRQAEIRAMADYAMMDFSDPAAFWQFVSEQ